MSNDHQVTALKIHVEKELSRLLGKAWTPECSIDLLITELQARVDTLEEFCADFSQALRPFAAYRRVADQGAFVSIGGSGGHAEINHKDWDKALTVYDGAQQ